VEAQVGAAAGQGFCGLGEGAVAPDLDYIRLGLEGIEYM
jgi:hypothetical protein